MKNNTHHTTNTNNPKTAKTTQVCPQSRTQPKKKELDSALLPRSFVSCRAALVLILSR